MELQEPVRQVEEPRCMCLSIAICGAESSAAMSRMKFPVTIRLSSIDQLEAFLALVSAPQPQNTKVRRCAYNGKWDPDSDPSNRIKDIIIRGSTMIIVAYDVQGGSSGPMKVKKKTHKGAKGERGRERSISGGRDGKAIQDINRDPDPAPHIQKTGRPQVGFPFSQTNGGVEPRDESWDGLEREKGSGGRDGGSMGGGQEEEAVPYIKRDCHPTLHIERNRRPEVGFGVSQANDSVERRGGSPDELKWESGSESTCGGRDQERGESGGSEFRDEEGEGSGSVESQGRGGEGSGFGSECGDVKGEGSGSVESECRDAEEGEGSRSGAIQDQDGEGEGSSGESQGQDKGEGSASGENQGGERNSEGSGSNERQRHLHIERNRRPEVGFGVSQANGSVERRGGSPDELKWESGSESTCGGRDQERGESGGSEFRDEEGEGSGSVESQGQGGEGSGFGSECGDVKGEGSGSVESECRDAEEGEGSRSGANQDQDGEGEGSSGESQGQDKGEGSASGENQGGERNFEGSGSNERQRQRQRQCQRQRRVVGDIERGIQENNQAEIDSAGIPEAFLAIIGATSIAAVDFHSSGTISSTILSLTMAINVFGFLCCMTSILHRHRKPSAARIFGTIGAAAAGFGLLLPVSVYFSSYYGWMILVLGTLAILVICGSAFFP